MIKITLPDTKYKQSYILAVKEFQEENNMRASNYLPINLHDLEQDFEAYVAKLLNQRQEMCGYGSWF